MAAVLVLWIVNAFIENAEAQRRTDGVERLITELRELTESARGAGWNMDDTAWRSSSAYKQLVSMDVRMIPLLLQHIDLEEEAVGRVLAGGIAELGQLKLSEADWENKESWKSAWDDHVDRAEKQVPIILADRQLNASEQATRLVDLGVPALPHLIGELQSGQTAEAGMIAIRQLLGPSHHVPSQNDSLQWLRWARSHAKEYASLTFKFE